MTPTPRKLLCEYLNNPIGLGTGIPRLSWQLHGHRPGLRQTAFQVHAELDGATVWDSGKIRSGSCSVIYNGPRAVSGQRILWAVRIWDEAGSLTDWSKMAFFEFGLLHPETEFKADWISSPLVGSTHVSAPVPLLQKRFSNASAIQSARLYATAIGLYEIELNGQPVTANTFTPGWSDYRKQVRIQTYDVGGLVRQGDNCLSVRLGDGRACGFLAYVFRRQYYTSKPAFRALLILRHGDGAQTVIPTDSSWTWRQSELLSSDIYNGEHADGRILEVLDRTDGWLPVCTGDIDLSPQLVSDPGPEIIRHEQRSAVDIHELPVLDVRFRYRYDFGQNLAGRCLLKVCGQRGTQVTLRHTEVLTEDGELCTDNLRDAQATDTYVLSGNVKGETWEPRFTYHGFRYVELTITPPYPMQQHYTDPRMAAEDQKHPLPVAPPDESTLQAVVLHTESSCAIEFNCSDQRINRLHKNIQWSIRSNLFDIVTDCVARNERLGWLGDFGPFAQTAFYYRDIFAFTRRWFSEMPAAQVEFKSYPCQLPAIGPGMGDGGPGWADAGIQVPWCYYVNTDDQRILQEHYPAMRAYLGWLEDECNDGIRCHPDYAGWQGFGDWLAMDQDTNSQPGELHSYRGATPSDLIGTAFLKQNAATLARIAEVLDRSDEAERFHQLSERTRQAFIKRFLHNDGCLISPTQTACILALHCGLEKEGKAEMILEQLVHDIELRDNHLSCGNVGAALICPVLTRFGRHDVACRLLRQDTMPSWLYCVDQGATTIWERWDSYTSEHGFGDIRMNSFNHYIFGAIGQWLVESILGIAADTNQPGFRHIIMAPQPPPGLRFVDGSVETVLGRIASKWQVERGRFHWEVVLPPNCQATLTFPTRDPSSIQETGLKTANKITQKTLSQNYFSVTSGHYQFQCRADAIAHA